MSTIRPITIRSPNISPGRPLEILSRREVLDFYAELRLTTLDGAGALRFSWGTQPRFKNEVLAAFLESFPEVIGAPWPIIAAGNQPGVGPMAGRIGFAFASGIGFDVLREFWPEISQRFKLPFTR